MTACGDDDGPSQPDAGGDEDGGTSAGRGGTGGGGGRGGTGGGGTGGGGRGGSGGGGSEECDDGYVLVDGECRGEDGTECEADADCENGHCVSGVCCASACDEPGPCRVADGATCEDGETCVYPEAEDGAECDDGDSCTENDECQDGTCEGSAIDCDDDNVCTADSCDPEEGCINDGTDITVACGDADACSSTGYTCAGNVRGDCVPNDPPDCSSVVIDDLCQTGMCIVPDGCVAVPIRDGMECDDGNPCTQGEVCGSGTCGGGEARVCDDGNPCTDDSCDMTHGCVTTNNTNTCDDGNPCTENDHCAGGLCQDSTPKNCSGQNDACNVGVCDPADGMCKKSPRPNTTSCNDGNSCTATDRCDDGECRGTGNACGAFATACTQGTPNDCTCMEGYVDNNAGQCVPDTDECDPNPCGANSTCTDPSSAPGNYVCGCVTGYMRMDDMCVDINECAGNPCGAGRGTCQQGPPGTYSCNCNAGYTEVGGTCVCDLNGTFAVQIVNDISWPAVFGALQGGRGLAYGWALVTMTYDDEGELRMDVRACGGTTPDLCGTGAYAGQAFAQYVPNHVWDLPSMRDADGEIEMSLPNAIPGQPFVTPEFVLLQGISLTEEMGDWPASRANVGGSNPTNGAVWVNHDGDEPPAITSLAVPPGGVVDDDNADGENNDPPIDYPATSSQCGGASYAYWPGIEFNIFERRLSEFYSASRMISAFDGTLTNCSLIEGDITGPNDGQFLTELRVEGCFNVDTESECSDSLANFLDNTEDTQTLHSSTFVMVRVANDFTCEDVITMDFDDP